MGTGDSLELGQFAPLRGFSNRQSTRCHHRERDGDHEENAPVVAPGERRGLDRSIRPGLLAVRTGADLCGRQEQQDRGKDHPRLPDRSRSPHGLQPRRIRESAICGKEPCSQIMASMYRRTGPVSRCLVSSAPTGPFPFHQGRARRDSLRSSATGSSPPRSTLLPPRKGPAPDHESETGLSAAIRSQSPIPGRPEKETALEGRGSRSRPHASEAAG